MTFTVQCYATPSGPCQNKCPLIPVLVQGLCLYVFPPELCVQEKKNPLRKRRVGSGRKKKNITSAKLQMVVSKSHLGGRCCSLRTFSRELLFIHHMAKLKSGQTQWKNWKSGNRGIQPCSTFPKNFLPILSFVCKSASTVSTSWGISQIANSCFTQIVEHFYNRGNKRILPFTKSQGTFLFRVYTPTYFLEKFQASYKVILNIEQDN